MKFERKLKPNVQIDLTPLIDVVFLLVLFFMLSSVFRVTPALQLELPKAGSAQTLSLTPLRISVDAAGAVWVNDLQSNLGELDAALSPALVGKDPAKLSVMVEADASVPYSSIVTILDVLRRKKVDNVRLMTRSTPGDKP